MFDFKKIFLNNKTTTLCPNCGEELSKGDAMFIDNDRNETVCAYCLKDYKKEVISEEGEDGRLLK